MEFQDLIYTEANGVATIAINRPKVYNAFSAHTCEELIQAFSRAGWNQDIGVVVLTGTGDKAFCSGADLKERAARTTADHQRCARENRSRPFTTIRADSPHATRPLPLRTHANDDGPGR